MTFSFVAASVQCQEKFSKFGWWTSWRTAYQAYEPVAKMPKRVAEGNKETQKANEIETYRNTAKKLLFNLSKPVATPDNKNRLHQRYPHVPATTPSLPTRGWRPSARLGMKECWPRELVLKWVVYDFYSCQGPKGKWIFVESGLHQKTNTLRQATGHARLHGATDENGTTSCLQSYVTLVTQEAMINLLMRSS